MNRINTYSQKYCSSKLLPHLNSLQTGLSELDQDDVDQRGAKWGRLRHEPGNENVHLNKVWNAYLIFVHFGTPSHY